MKHEELTKKIIGCCFEVINELGAGFLESVYEKSLVIALRDKGVNAVNQSPVRVYFRNECVGEFFADVLVEDEIIVELKATKALSPEHKAQVINYLKASEKSVGLLVNFGKARLEYKRLYGGEKPQKET